ncbi:MAG: putative signal recognition particle protein SRP54 [Candidatus Parvarchaeum acidophilus ARMAN-5_'5-way FS']|jgi:signal recognition particle subunit SRP54|uniref:signal-recognition-particle GTPase n=1 Tax=Candidatus Parvarchaeum acidophilus ARMAN-5_'5-way FS' TaxID=994838 RepID=F2UU81_PARA5|nr:MAG: putative signal recognition particle protein SRP54 [Candidatus Parvarchaeum acidophilus ARMAN-5_'5-way FS']
MAFENLSNRLKESIKKLLNSTGNEKVEEVLQEIQTALTEGDVDKNTLNNLMSNIRDDIKNNKGKGLVAKEKIADIIYNNLVKIVGNDETKINIDSVPFKILLVGLFGSGKTTTAAKLANYYRKRGYRVLLLGLDTFRPAAYQQLEQLSKQINVKIMGGGSDPIKAIKSAMGSFKNFDIIIADSAGRDILDKELIKEIKGIRDTLKPNNVTLVIPADLGQNASVQVKGFHELLDINNIILTKTDGTANGGGALTAAYISGAKVTFIGTGEKINDFEEFNPKKFVSKLLGLEGLESLLEKAQEENITVNEESAKRVIKGEFNLLDVYEQYSSAIKIGSPKKIAELMPGVPSSGKTKELLDRQEENIGKFIHIMDSMTKNELEEPKTIDSSRINRIAKGSGTSDELVRELLEQYKKMKTVMKMSNNRQFSGLLRRFGIKI